MYLCRRIILKTDAMGTLLNKAHRVQDNIIKQYNLLDFKDDIRFFHMFHDSLLCQVDGSSETVGEVEYYEEHGQNDKAEDSIQCLRDTLTYCKAVIKLMKQFDKLPSAIYG
jgi:hypothetical protein